ncbi:MAG TPA: glycosyltransferase family 9 protein [Candidatus Acidoferrales bacterium]|nr:glycosyltransferase family 9 protein [Candidatus Acidoferrales bacterium]
MKASNPAGILPGLPPGAEVLILRLRSLGDVVLTTPALAALRAWRPDLQLVVAVEPAFAPVLEGNPAVAETFIVGGFLPTAARLARRRFPIVFNQHGGPTSALLAAATGAPVRVAWEASQFRFLASVRVPGPEVFYGSRGVHTAEHRLTQFYWLGLPRGPVPPARMYPQPEALAAVERLLANHGIPPGRAYVVLQPGAAFATRRWALEHFAALGRWLGEDQGLGVVVALGPAERELVEQARVLFPPPVLLAAGLDLRQLAALLSRARLAVCNDTGTTHVAAAAGCAVVAIFGSTSPVHWRPWAVASRIVINEYPCRPCPGDRCYAFAEPRCILSVTVEQVEQACRELLAETAPAAGQPRSAPPEPSGLNLGL